MTDKSAGDKIANPDAYFENPSDVLADDALTVDQKRQALISMEADAIELDAAASENMAGGERGPKIGAIQKALRMLEKHGGRTSTPLAVMNRAARSRAPLFSKVLAALDFQDELAEPVARMAAAVSAGGELKLVTVAPPRLAQTAATSVAFSTPDAVTVMEQEPLKRRIAAREEFLRRLSASAGLSEAVNHEVRLGTPAAEIADCAEEYGADLIVIGAHHRGFLERLFQPSVSEKVARTATCAVLVAPEAIALGKAGQ
ncbi:MAG: universal stress protein [Parvularculaceae bacterium]